MPITHDALCDDYEKMWDNAVAGGVEYLKAYPNLNSLVVGLSGGIDSTFTAALARATIGKIDRHIELIGYSLPILSNKEDEKERAVMAGKQYCDKFAVSEQLAVGAMGLVAMIDHNLTDELCRSDTPADILIRIGNIKARCRMAFLYDRAQKYNGMVLSTDNLTEYLLGFWTLHGDVGDFGFIQRLWKTEVYGLAEWRGKLVSDGALLAGVDAKPTDGLGVSDSDLSQLLPDWKGSYRSGYECIDEILMAYTNGDAYIKVGDHNLPIGAMIETHPVLVRHLATHFKRENPTNLSRVELLNGNSSST